MRSLLPTSKLIERGRAAIEGGASLAALEELNEASRREPGYADVHNLRGICLSSLGRLEEAVQAFDAAVSINERFVAARRNRAAALRDLGREPECEADALEADATTAVPGDQRYPGELAARLANMHAHLGDMYSADGFLREATEQYRHACEIRPDFVDIRNKLARALIELGILEAAARELSAALELRPEYIDARVNLGLALYRAGRIDAARAEWERCGELSSRADVASYLALLSDVAAPSGTDNMEDTSTAAEPGPSLVRSLPVDSYAPRRPAASGRPLRVLHLIKNLQRGGAETLLVEGLRFMDPERYRYEFGYMLANQDALAGLLREQGASVTCFGAHGQLSVLLSAWRIARYLGARRIDLLHCHLPLVGVVGRLAGLLADVPVVYTEHNIWERYHPATKLVNRLTWPLQRHVIAVSGGVADSIRAGTRARVPVDVVLNGVDVKRFLRSSARGGGIRRELGIEPAAPVVGTIAIFKAQKRLDAWLQAAHAIRQVHPDARFIIVGDGPLRDEVRSRVVALGLESVVHLPGLRQEVRPYLAEMDVYMMSSVFEGLPVAMLEAMAMECAVVSTAVGGIPELVRHERTGLLVPVEQPQELAAAAVRLIDDPVLRDSYALAGRHTVVEEFSMERMVRNLEGIYSKVVDEFARARRHDRPAHRTADLGHLNATSADWGHVRPKAGVSQDQQILTAGVRAVSVRPVPAQALAFLNESAAGAGAHAESVPNQESS